MKRNSSGVSEPAEPTELDWTRLDFQSARGCVSKQTAGEQAARATPRRAVEALSSSAEAEFIALTRNTGVSCSTHFVVKQLTSF